MTPQVLDHATVPLDGMHLIEASAGTGKTWAIAALYLRMLLEKELSPEQILVVTYTEAATQELRARIRGRIREALDVMQGAESSDPFLEGLRRRVAEAGMVETAASRFDAALAAFDTASIFTIHGFCLRALQDNAFESGSLYDTELIADQKPLLREVADDFWRRRFFRDESPLLGYAMQQGCSPDAFMKLLRELQASPWTEVVPSFTDAEVSAIESACRAAYDEACRIWMEERQVIVGLLRTDKGLSRSEDGYRSDRIDAILERMEAFVSGGNPFDLFSGFGLLTVSGIRNGTKSSGVSPDHPLFHACEQLKAAVDDRITALKAELVAFGRERMPERKREGNVRFFDDLLEALWRVLAEDAGGTGLAGRLRLRYRAALIDEFQDTDPVQYAIFRKIYAGTGAPLFLIGDPKQAIYSFRGADIFAYLNASSEIGDDGRHTLVSNWRSDPALLRAFNLLFDDARRPFVFEGIDYHPLVPGKVGDATVDPPGDCGPLELCFMDPGTEDGNLNSGSAEQFATAACAAGVEALLKGGDGTTAGDVAVIVRTHRQARTIQDALNARGIASVMRSEESVFASRQAAEVSTLVAALADPGREPLVRSALATDIMGLSSNEIDRLNSDESAWVSRLQQFREYHRLWLEEGFMVMVRELMTREAVRQRLLDSPGNEGARILTNLLHCFELLHRAAHEGNLGVEGLVSWFGERVAAGEPGEEYQIRLESDEPAVRIVTVHVSKGLEYPVVFCPFLYGGLRTGDGIIRYHDDNGRLVKDFGSNRIAGHRKSAGREELAENLRLLYVALTRAKHRCVFFTGRVVDGRRKGTAPLLSPAAWLLHVPEAAKRSQDTVDVASRALDALSAVEMAQGLRELAEGSAGAIGYRRLLPEDLELEASGPVTAPSRLPSGYACRSFRGEIDTEWRVASFTSFSRNRKEAPELPDRDEPETTSVPPIVRTDDVLSIFTFDRGARAGILMHSLFEKLDFPSASVSGIDALVGRELDRQGYDRKWLPCLSGMVQEVISASISSPSGAFRLRDLQPGSWSTELEFHIPLKRITSPALAALLARHGAAPDGSDLFRLAESLDFRTAKGVLMGFMDMVFEADGRFWLIDWKSNHLGYSAEAYRGEALRNSMDEHLYTLQYLLYTVALDRYLAIRVPGYSYSSHFGGVVYVFLRGVQAGAGEATGLFRDLPDEALVRELGSILIETGEANA
ncbi:MAG: exodeoxyribonuclease V subunit beta [Chlorobiaceae bacterium]|nr:exodeoxyribonuclease V subunit beta [Chlorobiaceae bacterium]